MDQGSQPMKRLTPALLGLLLSAQSLAQAPPLQDDSFQKPPALSAPEINQALSELVNNQDFKQAYELAQQHLEVLEGDSQFDFHYGFSAAQSGFYNEAVFVFERLSTEYPQVPRYRLELARCHYALGQLDASERQFRLVQSSNPPNQVMITIDAFLRRIEEQRHALSPSWQGQASYSGGYDSNINSSSDIKEIDILLGGTEQRVRLNDDQTATSSGFYKLRGELSYSAPVTKRSGFDVRIGGQRKANAKTDDYDLNSVFIDGGLQLVRGYHHWRAGGRYQQYWLADDSLQNTLAANLAWKYRLTPDWRLTAKTEVRNNDNQLNDELDALQLEISAGPEYTHGDIAAQSALVISTDSTDDSPLAKDVVGLNLSGQYSLSAANALYGSFAWRNYSFQNKNPQDLLSNGKQRSENLIQLILGYNQHILPMLSAFGQFSYMDNQSNIDLYQYDRLLLEAGVTLAF